MTPRVPPHEGPDDQPIKVELSARANDPSELERRLDASNTPRANARSVNQRLVRGLAPLATSRDTAVDHRLALTNPHHIEEPKRASAREGRRLAAPARCPFAHRPPGECLDAIASPRRPSLPLASGALPRIERLHALLAHERPPEPDASDPTQRSLFVLLGWVRHPYADLGRALAHLWSRSPLLSELRQLLTQLHERSRWVGRPLLDTPLYVHGTYSLDEVLAGVDERSKKGGVLRIQTGVYEVRPKKLDLLFITLEKSAKHYTPTTLYDDYPISPSRFHWESQSTSHPEAPTGQRYLAATPTSDSSVVLFVRQRRQDDRGETMPYVCLGRAFYATHRGARPMQIEWNLETPMPTGMYQEGRRMTQSVCRYPSDGDRASPTD